MFPMHSASPAATTAPPLLGQHTTEVLGLGEDQIAELHARRIVA